MIKIKTFTGICEISGDIRVLVIGEEVYFVAKDLAEVLEYARPSKMYNHILPEYKTTAAKALGKKEAVIYFGYERTHSILVSKEGLYAAIFRSTKLRAKILQKWLIDVGINGIVVSLKNGGDVDNILRFKFILSDNAPKPKVLKSFVYLMVDEANGCHKIGMSDSPFYREHTLQSEKPTIKND